MARRRHRENTFRRGYMSDVNMSVQRLRAKGENVLTAAKLALAAGVDRIVDDAKSRCPVSNIVKEKHLRDSIKAARLEDGAAYELTADATNKNGIAYGQFVEFDPSINEPFLYPAIEANIDAVKSDIRQAIDDAIGR